MEYRCQKCGSEVSPGAKFCRSCGAVIEITPAKRLCPFCGNEVGETAKFCRNCGRNIGEAAPVQNSEPAEVPAVPVPEPQKQESAEAPAAPVPEPAAPPAPKPKRRPARRRRRRKSSTEAPVNAECTISADALTGTALPRMAGSVQVLNPFLTAWHSIKGVFLGLAQLGKHPMALIGMIVTAVLTLVFWFWNRSGLRNPVSEILSAVTFAEGGTRGTAGQLLGGLLGKGLVMTGIASLLSGGFRSIGGGFRRLLGKGLHIGAVLTGFGFAILCYQLFAGYAGIYGTAVAVSGAVVSLQALGGRAGFLRNLVTSLTARRSGKLRIPQDIRVKSLLTGCTVGFALSAGLAAFYIPWWFGLIFMAAGIVLLLLIKDKQPKEVSA